ncbi:MAG: hypothetical protein JSS87_06515 [Acidobacteria bacterium]|nr:hypothetical protein [Acidobacteriota bacterium]
MMETALILAFGGFLYLLFGILIPLQGFLLVLAPDKWARLPRYLRPGFKGGIPISTAWSRMRFFYGALCIGFGTFVNYLIINAAKIKPAH